MGIQKWVGDVGIENRDSNIGKYNLLIISGEH